MATSTHAQALPLHPSPIFSLSELADVQNGYATRKIQTGSTKVWLLRGGDVSCALAQPLVCARLARIPQHHVLQDGDVVFKIRGHSNPALLIKALQGDTICSAGLARIRIRDQARLLPAYLTWLLNAPQTQAVLEQHSLHNRIRVVPAGALQNLDILLPSLTRQQQIAQSYAQHLQIVEKERQLREKNQRYTDAALMQLAKFE
jgi:hypothetical protein